LGSDNRAPGQARDACRKDLEALMDGQDAQDVLDAALLVVSELVTNAVNAGCSNTVLDVALHRSHLRLSVHDDGPGQPMARDSAPDDDHGRGLRIVEELSRSWGFHAEGSGKQVWSELTVPVSLTAAIDCAMPMPA
jgi:anti-sigma regulatory factor (Ser/Thr protein kinase)